MKIEDVKRTRSPERRIIRVNLRITHSQNKFVEENNLSFTKIFDAALKQLGYVAPTLKDLKDSETIRYDSSKPIKKTKKHRHNTKRRY